MAALSDLYGTSQGYTNPAWSNVGQTYGTQPDWAKIQSGATGGMQAGAVGMNGSWAGGGTGRSTGGVSDVYNKFGQPGQPTGVPGMAHTMDQAAPQNPMASQPGIDQSRLWSNQSQFQADAPPIFGINDVKFQGNNSAQAPTTSGARDQYGQLIGSAFTPQVGGLGLTDYKGTSGPGNYAFSDVNGKAFDNATSWDPSSGFNLQLKNGAQTGNNYKYSLDPTGKYFMPTANGQSSMSTNTDNTLGVLGMLGIAGVGAAGAMGLGAAAGEGAGAAGAGVEGGYMGVGSTAGSGAGAGFGDATIAGSAAQGGAAGSGYMGTGSSAASGGGDLAAQGGYAQGTEALAGNAGELSSMTPQQLAQYYSQGQGVVNAVNGGGSRPTGQQTGNSMTNPDGSINWGSLLGGLAGAGYSYNQQDRYASAMKDLYTQAQQRAQPFMDKLNQSYTDPNSYLKGPEYTAIKDLQQNKIDRQASAQGRLSNSTDRDVLMQKFAMQNLGDYRKGLNDSAQGFMRDATSMAPFFQSGATADAGRGAGLAALIGNGQTNGGIPWSQLGQAGSAAWSQYAPQVSDWFSSWFGG